MARPHALSDPEMAQRAAELFAAGATREEMCEALGVSDVKTITRWRSDPRVTVRVQKIIAARVQEITRAVDGEIRERLKAPQDLTVKELIEIRKEFLGGQLREQAEQVDEHTINEAMSLFESDPKAAEQLRELLAGGAKAARPAN